MAVTGTPAAARLARRLQRPAPLTLPLLGAAACYLAFALFLTWPLGIHLDSRVYGGGGDTWGALAQWRELVGHNPWGTGRMEDLAAPEGLAVGYALNLATWPSTIVLYTLSTLFGEVFAANVFVL